MIEFPMAKVVVENGILIIEPILETPLYFRDVDVYKNCVVRFVDKWAVVVMKRHGTKYISDNAYQLASTERWAGGFPDIHIFRNREEFEEYCIKHQLHPDIEEDIIGGSNDGEIHIPAGQYKKIDMVNHYRIATNISIEGIDKSMDELVSAIYND